MDTAPPDLIVAAVCAVIVGNLLTIILVAGWRGYASGRRTDRGAPAWSYFALIFGGFFALTGTALLAVAIIAPML